MQRKITETSIREFQKDLEEQGLKPRYVTTHINNLKSLTQWEGAKDIEGTNIRQSMDDTVISKHAVSGYVGVQPKRGKWQAILQYKGKVYRLGIYEEIEDAIEARRKAKEKVMEDAAYLEHIYDELHKDEPLPGRPKMNKHKNKTHNGGAT